jgi:hypothetical protein
MKVTVVVTMILFSSAFVSAQNRTATNSETKLDQQSSPVNVEKTNAHPAKTGKFSSSSTPSKVDPVAVEEQFPILYQLNSVQDQRNRIENNTSISSSERTRQIETNTIRYQSKKAEFMKYISATGILNVSEIEQSFYLSCLKNDNKIDEYKIGIELINNNK